MWLFNNDKTFQYGICLNNCHCLENKKTNKTYTIFKGDLVKFFEFSQNNLVLTVLTNKCKLHTTKSSSFELIDVKLYKYLNGINDFEERLKFYRNVGRWDFVLHLQKNSVVNVACSNAKQIKALFLKAEESNSKILINVELLEEPSRQQIESLKNVSFRCSSKKFNYLLPASAIRQFNTPDIDQKFHENLQIDKTVWQCGDCLEDNLKDTKRCKRCSNQKDSRSIFLKTEQNFSRNFVSDLVIKEPFPPHENYDESFESCFSLKKSRNYQKNILPSENVHNCSTSRIGWNESNSIGVGTPKKKNISQNSRGTLQKTPKNFHEPHKNLTLDSSYHQDTYTGSNNVDLGQYAIKCDRKGDSDLIGPSISSTDMQINTWVCVVCTKLNVGDNKVCFNCGDETETFFNKPNSQTNVDSNLIVNSFTEIPTNPFEIDNPGTNNCITNGDDLMHHYESTVRQNDYETKCNICNCTLDISQGFLLRLCEHTVCEICIKSQITLEKLADSNNMPCCKRSIELNELKYFLPPHEYEQFKASLIDSNETNSYVQRCFGKNCNGYHLREEHFEDNPITFTCNKCKFDNCLQCRTIHVGLTCGQYSKLVDDKNSLDMDTVEMFLTWIREGIAMPCPKCEALIEKDEGCDWVQCPFCHTEICWATRGPRWGPGGKDDTSGGCRCDFKVKKCVENCNFCH